MVGVLAVNLHGFNRTTGDLDIWIKNEPANREVFRKILIELDYVDLSRLKTIDFIPGWTSFSLNS